MGGSSKPSPLATSQLQAHEWFVTLTNRLISKKRETEIARAVADSPSINLVCNAV